MTDGLRPQPVGTARLLFEAAFEHVKLLRHTKLRCADDADQRLLGVLCDECNIWWVAPHPVPGGPNDQWPGDLLHLHRHTGQGRKDYLAAKVTAAIKASPVIGKSVWERIKNRETSCEDTGDDESS